MHLALPLILVLVASLAHGKPIKPRQVDYASYYSFLSEWQKLAENFEATNQPAGVATQSLLTPVGTTAVISIPLANVVSVVALSLHGPVVTTASWDTALTSVGLSSPTPLIGTASVTIPLVSAIISSPAPVVTTSSSSSFLANVAHSIPAPNFNFTPIDFPVTSSLLLRLTAITNPAAPATTSFGGTPSVSVYVVGAATSTITEGGSAPSVTPPPSSADGNPAPSSTIFSANVDPAVVEDNRVAKARVSAKAGGKLQDRAVDQAYSDMINSYNAAVASFQASNAAWAATLLPAGVTAPIVAPVVAPVASADSTDAFAALSAAVVNANPTGLSAPVVAPVASPDAVDAFAAFSAAVVKANPTGATVGPVGSAAAAAASGAFAIFTNPSPAPTGPLRVAPPLVDVEVPEIDSVIAQMIIPNSKDFLPFTAMLGKTATLSKPAPKPAESTSKTACKYKRFLPVCTRVHGIVERDFDPITWQSSLIASQSSFLAAWTSANAARQKSEAEWLATLKPAGVPADPTPTGEDVALPSMYADIPPVPAYLSSSVLSINAIPTSKGNAASNTMTGVTASVSFTASATIRTTATRSVNSLISSAIVSPLSITTSAAVSSPSLRAAGLLDSTVVVTLYSTSVNSIKTIWLSPSSSVAAPSTTLTLSVAISVPTSVFSPRSTLLSSSVSLPASSLSILSSSLTTPLSSSTHVLPGYFQSPSPAMGGGPSSTSFADISATTLVLDAASDSASNDAPADLLDGSPQNSNSADSPDVTLDIGTDIVPVTDGSADPYDSVDGAIIPVESDGS